MTILLSSLVDTETQSADSKQSEIRNSPERDQGSIAGDGFYHHADTPEGEGLTRQRKAANCRGPVD